VKPPWISRDPGSGGFGIWAWISLVVIFAAAVYTDVSRFRNPSGEKYIPDYYYGGQADFSYAYLGARALLAKENPYVNAVPEFTHHIFKPELIDGEPYKQLYPPGHLLTYLPLAWLYGADYVAAGRVFFHFSLGFLVLLGGVIWLLLQRIREHAISPLFVFLAITVLVLHFGVQLGLERGQSDNLIALLCWAAVYAMAKQRVGLAMFLAVWATSIKGYPLLFTAGLGLIALRPVVWRRALLGAAIGVALFALPAAQYLPNALKAMTFRSEMFRPIWFNHGFRNVIAELVSPDAADRGRRLLTEAALLVIAIWGLRIWQYRRQIDSAEGLFALAMFCTAALLAPLGISSYSVSYNLILIIPGLVLLAASQDWLASTMALGPVARATLGVTVALASYTLFVGRWGENFPLAGVGLLIAMGLLGVLGVSLSPDRRSAMVPFASAPTS
jgi:hypothetical protein